MFTYEEWQAWGASQQQYWQQPNLATEQGDQLLSQEQQLRQCAPEGDAQTAVCVSVSEECPQNDPVDNSCAEAVDKSAATVPLLAAPLVTASPVAATLLDVPLVAATLADVPLVGATLADAPLVAANLADAPMVAATAGAPLVAATLAGAPLVAATLAAAEPAPAPQPPQSAQVSDATKSIQNLSHQNEVAQSGKLKYIAYSTPAGKDLTTSDNKCEVEPNTDLMNFPNGTVSDEEVTTNCETSGTNAAATNADIISNVNSVSTSMSNVSSNGLQPSTLTPMSSKQTETQDITVLSQTHGIPKIKEEKLSPVRVPTTCSPLAVALGFPISELPLPADPPPALQPTHVSLNCQAPLPEYSPLLPPPLPLFQQHGLSLSTASSMLLLPESAPPPKVASSYTSRPSADGSVFTECSQLVPEGITPALQTSSGVSSANSLGEELKKRTRSSSTSSSDSIVSLEPPEKIPKVIETVTIIEELNEENKKGLSIEEMLRLKKMALLQVHEREEAKLAAKSTAKQKISNEKSRYEKDRARTKSTERSSSNIRSQGKENYEKDRLSARHSGKSTRSPSRDKYSRTRRSRSRENAVKARERRRSRTPQNKKSRDRRRSKSKDRHRSGSPHKGNSNERKKSTHSHNEHESKDRSRTHSNNRDKSNEHIRKKSRKKDDHDKERSMSVELREKLKTKLIQQEQETFHHKKEVSKFSKSRSRSVSVEKRKKKNKMSDGSPSRKRHPSSESDVTDHSHKILLKKKSKKDKKKFKKNVKNKKSKHRDCDSDEDFISKKKSKVKKKRKRSESLDNDRNKKSKCSSGSASPQIALTPHSSSNSIEEKAIHEEPFYSAETDDKYSKHAATTHINKPIEKSVDILQMTKVQCNSTRDPEVTTEDPGEFVDKCANSDPVKIRSVDSTDISSNSKGLKITTRDLFSELTHQDDSDNSSHSDMSSSSSESKASIASEHCLLLGTPEAVSSTTAEVTSIAVEIPNTSTDLPNTPAEVSRTPTGGSGITAEVPKASAELPDTPADVSTCPSKVSCTQAELADGMPTEVTTTTAEVSARAEVSTAASVSSARGDDEASGFVFSESVQLYYDKASGYYYDAVSQVLFILKY